MKDEKKVETPQGECSEELLKKLLYLKGFETPVASRMVRNRQEIMRQVRHLQQEQRKGLLDMIELKFPWFFAEPKYGVALLFVAFAALQYLGVNARFASQTDFGVHMPRHQQTVSSAQAPTVSSVTNHAVYAKIPDDPSSFRLFDPPTTPAPDVNMVEYLREY